MKTWHPTKQAWAEAKANELREQALNLPGGISRSRRISNSRTGAYLYEQASRYDRMAERFRAQGV